LFLTKFPITYVAAMWMAYAPASSVAAIVYTRLAKRVRRTTLVIGFLTLASASYAVLRILIGQDVHAAYAVFAVWSEVIANFAGVLVWTVAQDFHDAQSAKRLFGIIGSGYIVGTVVSGFLTGAVVGFIGTDNLIVVLILALVAIGVLTRALAKRYPFPERTR